MKELYEFIWKIEGQRVIDTSMDDVIVLKHILKEICVKGSEWIFRCHRFVCNGWTLYKR
jgi:hypothetical protein